MLAVIIITNTLFSSCKEDDHKNISNHIEVDLPSFFNNEVKRLNIENPAITKTVSKNVDEETKSINIKDWEIELASFLTIDLNKAAYKGLFKKDSINNTVTYLFTDNNTELSEVIINYDNNVIEKISIKKHAKNLLYNTEENLWYEKGKTYKVEKKQHVWILGDTHYVIKGVF